VKLDLKNELNPEQLRAVTYQGAPLSVLAGAGSGKTRVLTYRAYWLIKESGVDPKKIVLLTFTNKAATEMSKRIDELLTSNVQETNGQIRLGFAGTFHGFCVRLLRIHGEEIGVSKNFTIYDVTDQKQAMKNVLRSLGEEDTAKKVRMYLAMISKYKNSLTKISEIRSVAGNEYQKNVVKVWSRYRELLRKCKALDFDDLLTRCVDLLRTERVRKLVNKQFEWILVDEYQDTNNAQFELTRLLADDPKKLTVVGDASQAIYSFRGADFRNLKLLKEHFKDLEIIELVENYRSTQNILDAAHQVIENNTGHPILKLKTSSGGGDKVVVFEGQDGRMEARFVVKNCGEAVNKGRNVAVLYRTNAQSRVLEEELIRSKILYRLIGGVRFYERKEIKDLLAHLRVVVNPSDTVAWERIEKLGKRRRRKYEDWLEGFEEKDLSPVDILERILELTDYASRFDKKSEEDIARLENIDELLAVASEFADIETFLESVALIQAEDVADQKLEAEKEVRVTLMTIHSAKGLEFDDVFVVGMEEGLLPHSRSLLEKDSLEEERRLMYVAITRARQKLYLSYANLRFLYGGRSTQTPSRFLAEIPATLTYRPATPRPDTRPWRRWRGDRKKDDQKEVSRLKTTTITKERVIVQDWEVEKESKDDFKDIDSW
jgi:DNA helicase II / ATP-dependent DNA helicase PcrA